MCKATLLLHADMCRHLRVHMRCPACREIFEAGKDCCYCPELLRRRAYDEVREEKGLVPLYRPPNMR